MKCDQWVCQYSTTSVYRDLYCIFNNAYITGNISRFFHTLSYMPCKTRAEVGCNAAWVTHPGQDFGWSEGHVLATGHVGERHEPVPPLHNARLTAHHVHGDALGCQLVGQLHGVKAIRTTWQPHSHQTSVCHLGAISGLHCYTELMLIGANNSWKLLTLTSVHITSLEILKVSIFHKQEMVVDCHFGSVPKYSPGRIVTATKIFCTI